MSGIRLNVEAETRQMLKHLKFSELEVVPKAASRALNDMAKKAKTVSSRSIAKQAGIKQKAFKKKMVLIKSKPSNLIAAVIVKKLRFNLIKYNGTRQTKRGVASSSWGKRKTYDGTFIATMKNGRRMVMRRKSDKRLPIKGVWGASITKTFVDQEVKNEMDRAVRAGFKKRFKQHVAFYSGKK